MASSKHKNGKVKLALMYGAREGDIAGVLKANDVGVGHVGVALVEELVASILGSIQWCMGPFQELWNICNSMMSVACNGCGY